MNKTLRFILPLCFLMNCAQAGDRWSLNITPQASYGNYDGSPTRNRIYSEGMLFNLQYLERFAVLYGYFPLQLYYKNNIPALYQDTNYFSVRDFQTQTFFRLLTLQLDGYRIRNDDQYMVVE